MAASGRTQPVAQSGSRCFAALHVLVERIRDFLFGAS